jgi:SUMO ligase MMS21 Smc5/6 complex component
VALGAGVCVWFGQADAVSGLICPIMRKLLEDPTRSKVCGHVFSKDGILSMFKGNKHEIRCPVPGEGRARVLCVEEGGRTA